MVATCHLAGVILSGAKNAPMVTSMDPEYYSARGEIALLVMIRTSEEFSLMVKNTLTSSAMVTGSPTICTSGKIM